MTWGSNPSFKKLPCKYCKKLCLDDKSGLSSHELVCVKRPWWKKLIPRIKEMLQ